MKQQGIVGIFVLILILVVAVAGGAYYLRKVSNKSQVTKTQQPAQITPSPDPTANWKTYTNTKYGFEFRYPSDHTPYTSVDQQKPALVPAGPTNDKVTIAAEEEMVFCCEPATLSFSMKITDKKAREWVEEYLSSVPEWKVELPTIEDVFFAGKPAVEANGRGGYGPPSKLIVVYQVGYLLIIVQNPDDPLLNNILSTFKFTSQ